MTSFTRFSWPWAALLKAMMASAATFLVGLNLFAADDLRDLFGPRPTPFERELRPIRERIDAKLLAGSHEREQFTNELNAIEELLKRYPQEHPEKIAEVRYGLAIGHWRTFNDPKRAIELLEELRRDFPQTSYAKKAALDIKDIPKIDAGILLRQTIEVGKPLPDFEVQDLSGQALSVMSCRGKPVLILSWDVNTAPLLQFKKLMAFQQKYEPDTFEVIALSMDQDEKEVRGYLKTNNIPWRHYFDGRGVRNELVLKYNLGLASYAFVLDRQGRVVALAPPTLEDVEAAMVKALQKQ